MTDSETVVIDMASETGHRAFMVQTTAVQSALRLSVILREGGLN